MMTGSTSKLVRQGTYTLMSPDWYGLTLDGPEITKAIDLLQREFSIVGSLTEIWQNGVVMVPRTLEKPGQWLVTLKFPLDLSNHSRLSSALVTMEQVRVVRSRPFPSGGTELDGSFKTLNPSQLLLVESVLSLAAQTMRQHLGKLSLTSPNPPWPTSLMKAASGFGRRSPKHSSSPRPTIAGLCKSLWTALTWLSQ